MHGSVWDRLHDVEASYRPSNLHGGKDALHVTNIDCEDNQPIYEYRTAIDQQPWQNNWAVRWAVMLAVSAADLLVVVVAAWAIRWLWHLCRAYLTHHVHFT